MSCHTWFSVPFSSDKEEILKYAQQFIESEQCAYLSEGHKKMYQYAIDNQLEGPVCELAESANGCHRSNDWTIYMEVTEHSLYLYNKANNTNLTKYSDEFNRLQQEGKLESYSNEPRIAGYPDDVIRSYDDMCTFIMTGHVDEKDIHHKFRLEEDRRETTMRGIKTFFEKHPKGIITFG